MSHPQSIEVEVKDFEALKKAAIKLGCEVKMKAHAKGWAQDKFYGEMVINPPNTAHGFGIAVNKGENGSLVFKADLHGKEIQNSIGTTKHPYGRLIQQYYAEKIESLRKKSSRIREAKQIQSKNPNEMKIEVTLPR